MKNLRTLREEKRLSQQRLAQILESSQQNICRYEKGYNEPDNETLRAMANLFDTSVDYLLGNTDIRHKIEVIAPFDLNEEEASAIKKFRFLNPDERKIISDTMDAFLGKKTT